MHFAGVLCALLVTLAVEPPPAVAQVEMPATVEVGARNPAVSPDGSSLAASILGKIWTLPYEGGAATPLTSGPGWDRHPAWSPDGRFLAYSHWTASGSALLVRNLATGTVRQVHAVPDEIQQIDFDPAGRHLYFVRQRSQYEAHLWSVPVQGGEARQLTHTPGWHEWSFALAPGGDRMLLENGRYEGTDLYILEVDSLRLTRRTETPMREAAVAWSPDGRRQAWVERHDGVDRIVMSMDGGAPSEIRSLPYGQTELTFSPDGDLLVASSRKLARVDLATGDGTWRPIPFTADLPVSAAPEDDLVLTGVRLFDGRGDQYLENAWVIVRAGLVDAVGTGPLDAPPGVPVIDGRGRTLLPGLMDNHYHFWRPHAGPDLLARGVTTIRDPGVAIADGMDYKDASAWGLLAAPTIFSTGPLLDGPGGYHPMVDVTLEHPGAAAALVRGLAEQGVDALKAYFLLEPEVLAAVMAEAGALGLPVTGHLGVRTSWAEALDLGIDGLSHVRVWRDLRPPEVQPDGRDGTLDRGRDITARMQADWSDIDVDGPDATALIDRMVQAGVAIDPTLLVQRVDDDSRDSFTLEEFPAARESFERMKAFVARAVAAGVPLLAGTDNLSLVDELGVYQDAGIPNAEILRAATINGARWLGRDSEIGTVEPGRRAHLVLVDGDPLADIRSLREVDLVVKDGVVVFRRGG